MKSVYLYLNSRDELLRLDIRKIAYFEADGNYTNVVSANGLKGVVCMNLMRMQEVLSERLREQSSIFARVGKKYIVNLTLVYQVNVLRQKLVLSDGERFAFTLDISKEALKNLKGLFEGALTGKRE